MSGLQPGGSTPPQLPAKLTRKVSVKDVQDHFFTRFVRVSGGGAKFDDEEEVKKQRGVAWTLIKEGGNKLMEGKDLTSLTLPVTVFESRSFLERIAMSWAHIDLLKQAAAATTPAERLYCCVAFAVAGLHLTIGERKPFNPILGETYEAAFPCGTSIYCEQSTHHPPASSFQVECADGSYHLHGSVTWSAHYRGNSLKGYQHGLHHVDFADGTTVSWNLPVMNVKGIVWGDRQIEWADRMVFQDRKNGLVCPVTFQYDSGGFMKALGWGKSATPDVDMFRGYLYEHTYADEEKAGGADGASSSSSSSPPSPPPPDVSSRKDHVGCVEGSWLTHVEADGKTYWRKEEHAPTDILPDAEPLLSDCRFRADLQALHEAMEANSDESGVEYEKARELKNMLEQKQRREAKLRKRYKKAH